ncbi:MAG: hypothetical protein LBS17_03635 [Actinomycetes bacterium]|jgi:phosphomannomutase|nr:hypothetical protein [Actinomycetes bacterium]
MSAIHFGTDGWRAQYGTGADGTAHTGPADFTDENLTAVATATAQVFLADYFENCPPSTRSDTAGEYVPAHPPTVYVGYDTRDGADRFAARAADAMASAGLRVILSDAYIPTPGLCWSVATDPAAVGGVQLTASHNPAGWLGFKVRMADGGAAQPAFTDRIESLISTPPSSSPHDMLQRRDLVTPYLANLATLVDADAIAAAAPQVVVDSLYGAGRGYLAQVLSTLGARVTEIHADAVGDFAGLHPEPIPPWTDDAATAVRATGATAAFVTDGDADRIGAVDRDGNFVSPHVIIALLADHLVRDRGKSGRIVKSLAMGRLIERVGAGLHCPVITTPIGFKYIYGEMLAGDVLIGGEESGGLGVPDHVRERDGLLMALLLTEMMAQRGVGLAELVADIQSRYGRLYYHRDDLRLDADTMDAFRAKLPTLEPATVAGRTPETYLHTDGLKMLISDDEWLMVRASGTEPLLRVYAEAASPERLQELLAAGRALAGGPGDTGTATTGNGD